jgi:hypothetical protein
VIFYRSFLPRPPPLVPVCDPRVQPRSRARGTDRLARSSMGRGPLWPAATRLRAAVATTADREAGAGAAPGRGRTQTRGIVNEWMTLDGVVQAPSEPGEDTSDRCQHGGWRRPCMDDDSAARSSTPSTTPTRSFRTLHLRARGRPRVELPSKCLARSPVQLVDDRGHALGGVPGSVGLLWQVLAQQSVRVLVAAPLPGAVGVAK